MKYIIYILMLVVLYCLGSASYYMLKSQDAEKMAKALTWRIGLSLLIFVLLFVGFAMGWLVPHQLIPN
ncbi:MAG: twin transmembrane helix small protein [Pseudomonadota bacterium]|nr:twin transmembrane helix small protein [Pseudomonadota bacterium]